MEGLIFRPGQLVRLELLDSDVAADEGSFAQMLGEFLARARAGKREVVEEAEALQGLLGEVALFLGEPVGSDPSNIFMLLEAFSKDFDASLVRVMKKIKYL